MWIKYNKIVPGKYFCLTLSNEEEFFHSSNNQRKPFFVIEDSGKGLGLSMSKNRKTI